MSSVIDLANVSPQQSVLVSYPKSPDAASTLYMDTFATKNADDTTNETVVGVEVVLRKGDPNGLWDRLNVDLRARKLDPGSPKVATRSLTIACDTLRVHGPFCLPEADVSIFARRIEWATDDAAIVTTPQTWAVPKAADATRTSNAGDGAEGRNAGTLTVLAAEEGPPARIVTRLQANGGHGQDPGKGLRGQDGSVMASWSQRVYTLNDSNISTSKGTVSFDPPAVYIDYEWRWAASRVTGGTEGSNTFPTNGTDSRAAGRPGSGGDGGQVTTNLPALAASAESRGGGPGRQGSDYRGGSAGWPHSAGKYKVKLWHNLFGTNNASTEVTRTASNTSKKGADKPAPAPKRGRGKTPQPKVVQTANTWLHPLGVQRALAYARDLLLAGAREEALALLAAYEAALAAPVPDTGAWSTADQASWTAAQSEVASMVQRLEAHLDYFGHAAGYTPLLSLPGMVKLYADETRRALKTQLLVEWIIAKERDTKALAAALTSTIDTLNQDTDAAAAQIASAEGTMAKLTGDLDALEQELSTLSNHLDVLRNRLMSKAQNDLDVQAQIKFGIRIAAAICQVVPVGQPALGTVGSLAGLASEFVGDDGTKAPDTISKMGDVITKAREAAKKADEAKKKAAKEKSKDKPGDAKQAKSSASAWAKVGDGLGPALSQVSAGLKALQVPKSEVEAQLERLQSESPEWNDLVATITDLNERKIRLFESLTTALQDLGESYGRVSANAAALISLQESRSKTAARLDPAATGFVKDMGQRSRLTLLKYLYLMVRAYETTVVQPIDVDWQLAAVTKKINALIAPEDGFDAKTLEAHVKALAPIFESNLDTVRTKLLEDFGFNERTTTLRLALTQQDTPAALDALNGLGETVVNPLRSGLVLPDQQLARFSAVTLKTIAFDPAGPQLPDTHNMVIALQPVQRGTLRREAGLFAVYSDAPIGWSWTYLGPKDIRPSKPSQGAEDVLNLILGDGAERIKQKVALPPAWSDLALSVLISPALPAEQRPRIAELQFELACDQDAAPANQAALIVQNLGDVPGVVVDCTADLDGRAAALNQMLRVYAKGAKVRLTVPGALGGATFEGWDLLGRRVTRTGIQEPSVEVDMDDHVLARCHWSVAGEHVSRAAIAHVMPMAEIDKIVAEHEDVQVRQVMKRAKAVPAPAPERLLRAAPERDAAVVGLVPAGVEPRVLDAGPRGWCLVLRDGVTGWLEPAAVGAGKAAAP